jgi:exosortase/archaeosortase family protein
VRTATSLRYPTAGEFVATATAWSVGLFAILRLSWVEVHAVLPATQFQGAVAFRVFGSPAVPIEATLACSGTDALALCLAAILAYPTAWRSRIAGAAGGIALLLLLNISRIGTLGLAAATPRWFETLHVLVWPMVLTMAIAGYVFWWMRSSETEQGDTAAPAWQPPRRFIVLTLAFLVIFVISAPLYLNSALVLALAGVVAQSSAALLNGIGAASQVTANVLSTPGGHFLVTQECLVTPLIPVYLAAVFAFSSTRRGIAAGVVAAVPLFMVLGVIRLLLVALPPAIGSPLFFVHAFYQLALALVVIVIAAAWRYGRIHAWRYALAGTALAVGFAYLAAPLYASAASYNVVPIDDPQQAIASLPVFQGALYLALSVAMGSSRRWQALLGGFAVLTITQLLGTFVVQAIADTGYSLAVREVRGWAILAPLIIVAVISHVAPPRP